jgi:hypothetical protein
VTDFVGRFLAFWAEFLIGDDWALAAGVVVALALARVASMNEGALGEFAWMIAPIGVVLVLVVSLARAAWSSEHSD